MSAPRPEPPTTPDHSGPSPDAAAGERVLLFDGVCNLCNAWARFVLARDKRARIRLASLQSAAGQRLLAGFGLPSGSYDTVVFIEDGEPLVRSTAVLHLLRHLPWPWSWLSAARWTPRPWRDAVYGFVAARRYRWFGRRDSCVLPTAAQRARFLE